MMFIPWSFNYYATKCWLVENKVSRYRRSPYGGSKEYKAEKVGDKVTKW